MIEQNTKGVTGKVGDVYDSQTCCGKHVEMESAKSILDSTIRTRELELQDLKVLRGALPSELSNTQEVSLSRLFKYIIT